MRADLSKRNTPLLKQVDQKRTRNIQKVGGLLSCELGLNGDYCDRVAVGHLPEDFEEQVKGLLGHNGVLVSGM